MINIMSDINNMCADFRPLRSLMVHAEKMNAA